MAIGKALKMDLPALAEMLRSKGRGKDTILAHITPREAALLKKRGGSGTINPDTGLPEFEDDFYSGGDMGYVAPPSPVYDVVQPSGQFQPTYAETKGVNAGTEYPVAPAYTPGDLSAYAPATDTGYSFQATRPGETGIGFQAAPQQQVGTISVPKIPTGLGVTPTAPGLGMGAGQEALRTAQLEGAAPTPKDTGVLGALGKLATPEALARLGLAGGLGLYGAGVARKGAAQTQAAAQQQQAIAQPYQQQGQQLVAQAQRGELTPQSQQAYQAAQAQINQGIAQRGGVGAQQAANQMANLYQTLLNNQYTYGLNVMNIGDQISLGAIRSGLQLDQQMQQSTTNFYSQLAAIAAGGGGMGTPQTVRVVQ